MANEQTLDPERKILTHKELAEVLIKREGIHEGIWGVFIRFGLSAGNLGKDESSVYPSAIVPVIEIGIQRFPTESNIAVDASKVNPLKGNGRKALIAARKKSLK